MYLTYDVINSVICHGGYTNLWPDIVAIVVAANNILLYVITIYDKNFCNP